MKHMTLDEVFGPMAWGEFRWRLPCAVTEENVAEAVVRVRREFPDQWGDWLENLENYGAMTDGQWQEFRLGRMGSWIIRTAEQGENLRRHHEQEDAEIAVLMRRGVNILLKYLESNHP